MLTATILLVVIVLPLSFRASREWVIEELKVFSDFLIIGLLRLTSRFGSELTEDGRAEQSLWSEQRLRNLRGLALRAKEAFNSKRSAAGKEEEQEKAG